MSQSKATYHHGNLRPALVRAAMELLEEGGGTALMQFALERPSLFRIMFGEPCDRDNDERVAATAAVSAYVRSIAQRTFPQADADALATAIWALVHGLAFLYLDGKLDAPTPSAVADRVTAAVEALLTGTSALAR
jgi:hypothetical protein